MWAGKIAQPSESLRRAWFECSLRRGDGNAASGVRLEGPTQEIEKAIAKKSSKSLQRRLSMARLISAHEIMSARRIAWVDRKVTGYAERWAGPRSWKVRWEIASKSTSRPGTPGFPDEGWATFRPEARCIPKRAEPPLLPTAS